MQTKRALIKLNHDLSKECQIKVRI